MRERHDVAVQGTQSPLFDPFDAALRNNEASLIISASVDQNEKYWPEPTAYDFAWRKVGKQFTATLDEAMPEYYEEGDVIPVALYRIGHSNDSSRHPLYTTNKDKAMLVLGGR